MNQPEYGGDPVTPDAATVQPAGPGEVRPRDSRVSATPDRGRERYSVVIPVYESADFVEKTIDDVLDTFTAAGLDVELILVNDGSKDNSWEVISARARADERIVALNLLHNYGQHYANLAGLRESTGDYVITMDDDGQNPADQALLLVQRAREGYDVVFGQFETKQARGYRRLGSKVIGMMNRRVFGQPKDLTVSNFRILRRDVVERICRSRTAYPYITGQALLYSNHRANVTVRHAPRVAGTSHYSFLRILKLVFTILFSYTLFPLRVAAIGGFLFAGIAFLMGLFYFINGLVGDRPIAGWTSIMVVTAVFNGVIIAILSMLGEYVVRTLNTVSADETFFVLDRVSKR